MKESLSLKLLSWMNISISSALSVMAVFAEDWFAMCGWAMAAIGWLAFNNARSFLEKVLIGLSGSSYSDRGNGDEDV